MRGLLGDGAIPLNAGAYQTRGSIAQAQRCWNLFPEINPAEADPAASVTHYPRPGLATRGNLPPVRGVARGIFTASNGNLYSVVGPNVYFVDAGWAHHPLGVIAPATTPVSLVDNGHDAVVVDGSATGYSFSLGTNAWNGPIVDPTGTFVGATRADVVDTFFTFNMPGTNQWTCSDSGSVTFNALQTGAKSSYPDPIVTQIANLRQVWLLGSQTSEVWFLSGATPFPFEEWPNVFVPYGIAAAYSLARTDSNLFWVSRNKDGQVIIVANNGYAVEAISTRALEFHFTNFPTVADAIGYTYQQGGHTFYVVHFPTADESYGYDLSTKQWHQRISIDNNGELHRERVAFHAFVSDKNGYPNTNVGQDWQTGQLYALDQNTYTDNGQPIPCVRSFPHVLDALKELTAISFVADFETGDLANTGEIDQRHSPWSNGWSNGFGPLVVDKSPQLAMRVSKNGGGTFGNYRMKGLISAGHFRSMMRWRGIGMGRDFVFELAWSAPMPTSLQGAYLDPVQHGA